MSTSKGFRRTYYKHLIKVTCKVSFDCRNNLCISRMQIKSEMKYTINKWEDLSSEVSFASFGLA